MGRKKKPIDVVVKDGKKHLTKKEIEERQAKEIKPTLKSMKPPDELRKELHKRFKYYVELLNEHKIVDTLDLNMLARYVEMEHIFWIVTKQLNEVLNHPTADVREVDKLSSIQDRYMKACRSMANDLGLTMFSRLKMSVSETEKEEGEKTEAEMLFGDML